MPHLFDQFKQSLEAVINTYEQKGNLSLERSHDVQHLRLILSEATHAQMLYLEIKCYIEKLVGTFGAKLFYWTRGRQFSSELRDGLEKVLETYSIDDLRRWDQQHAMEYQQGKKQSRTEALLKTLEKSNDDLRENNMQLVRELSLLREQLGTLEAYRGKFTVLDKQFSLVSREAKSYKKKVKVLETTLSVKEDERKLAQEEATLYRKKYKAIKLKYSALELEYKKLEEVTVTRRVLGRHSGTRPVH